MISGITQRYHKSDVTVNKICTAEKQSLLCCTFFASWPPVDSQLAV